MARQKDTIIVHFDFNRSDITARASSVLDSIAQANETGKLQQIILYGHCDFIGSNGYNDSLSQARISSVKNYLLSKGIAASLFQQETAYGERKPAVRGSSDAARAMNRRVELIVIPAAAVAAVPDLNIPPTPARPTLTEMIRDTAVGKNLVLENLNFIGGRHFLLAESAPILQELLQALQDNPGLKIEIQGYVCCTRGDEDGYDWDEGTYDLSVRRARAIHDYLVEKGIDASRLSYQGFGGSRKIFPAELNEFQRSRNRRVEIKIISK